VIGGDAVHVDGLFGDAAEEVSSADNDGDLTAATGYLSDLVCDCVDEDCINTETTACGQGFSGELEEDTLVHTS